MLLFYIWCGYVWSIKVNILFLCVLVIIEQNRNNWYKMRENISKPKYSSNNTEPDLMQTQMKTSNIAFGISGKRSTIRSVYIPDVVMTGA